MKVAILPERHGQYLPEIETVKYFVPGPDGTVLIDTPILLRILCVAGPKLLGSRGLQETGNVFYGFIFSVVRIVVIGKRSLNSLIF